MDPSDPLVRPATPADLAEVRGLLAEAIHASPHYNARFKAHEAARFSVDHLRALVAVDPWHVAVSRRDGKIAGVIVTTPEFGTLWVPWIYVVPHARSRALGVSMTRFMIRHWDHGRFHKIACFVRPENRAPQAVLKHFGFTETALLRQHIFGEDYLLLERPLTKAIDGYDSGVPRGRLRALRFRLRDRLGLRP